MSFLQGGVAVVTGAGSGIGRALAQQLFAAGSALAIADIDEKGLAETAASLTGKQAALSTHVLDVSEEAAVKGFAEDVVARHGRVTLLINNAGVALHGTFRRNLARRPALAPGNQFLGRRSWREVFPASLEATAARADCKFVERIRDYCSCGAERVFREQICRSRIHRSREART